MYFNDNNYNIQFSDKQIINFYDLGKVIIKYMEKNGSLDNFNIFQEANITLDIINEKTIYTMLQLRFPPSHILNPMIKLCGSYPDILIAETYNYLKIIYNIDDIIFANVKTLLTNDEIKATETLSLFALNVFILVFLRELYKLCIKNLNIYDILKNNE